MVLGAPVPPNLSPSEYLNHRSHEIVLGDMRLNSVITKALFQISKFFQEFPSCMVRVGLVKVGW
jgi:hypothetical protein